MKEQKLLLQPMIIFKNKIRSFTVIELLVVIAIIGFIASIVLVNLKGVRGRARDAKRMRDIFTLKEAILLYATEYEEWPGVGDGGGIHISPKCNSDLKNDLMGSGILGIIPTDPLDEQTACNDNSDGAFFYGWDSGHCCGGEMCISINTFETQEYIDKYGSHSVIGGGDANIGTGDHYNYCFEVGPDTDTVYGN